MIHGDQQADARPTFLSTGAEEEEATESDAEDGGQGTMSSNTGANTEAANQLGSEAAVRGNEEEVDDEDTESEGNYMEGGMQDDDDDYTEGEEDENEGDDAPESTPSGPRVVKVTFKRKLTVTISNGQLICSDT